MGRSLSSVSGPVDQHPAHAEADRGAEPVISTDQGALPPPSTARSGAARELLQQHGLRRRRRPHRLLPSPVCAPAGRSVQLGPAGGRQQSGHRVERSSWDRRQSSCDRSAQRLDSERQQLALFSAAGPYSPKQKKFPAYMDNAGESPRGLHAIMVLDGRKDFSPERLRDAAFDTYLPAFARLVPPLVAAYDSIPASADTLKRQLAEPIETLRKWNYRWSSASVATALAVPLGARHWPNRSRPMRQTQE